MHLASSLAHAGRTVGVYIVHIDLLEARLDLRQDDGESKEKHRGSVIERTCSSSNPTALHGKTSDQVLRLHELDDAAIGARHFCNFQLALVVLVEALFRARLGDLHL